MRFEFAKSEFSRLRFEKVRTSKVFETLLASTHNGREQCSDRADEHTQRMHSPLNSIRLWIRLSGLRTVQQFNLFKHRGHCRDLVRNRITASLNFRVWKVLVSSDESDLKVSLLRNSERVNSKRVVYKKISQMLRCAHLSPCNMVHVPTASMAKKNST